MTIFPKWPQDVVRDVKEKQTYCDPDVLPLELRTKRYRKEFENGGFESVEVITTLRRCYLGVYAEIVLISYWISWKQDGAEFYQVNLVSPHNVGFARNRIGIISLDDNRGFGELRGVMTLLADAKKFIEWHENVYRKKYERS